MFLADSQFLTSLHRAVLGLGLGYGEGWGNLFVMCRLG